ncbi:DMT family transporter [Rhodohalobacter sp.]|uniref:DMT family transporter n=1 Tax=Rhodohalobacter sp. TaxID=1974210 RepID=UPI002ACD79CF|nr:DMT family transporter [Rhodohalobacter sp.]MDZ7755666.1 DMT family transporter [Rhodohalobacter sp.]
MSNSPQNEVPLTKVVTLLVVGLLTFGFAPIMVRFATDVEPLALAAMRTGFSALMLLPFWFPKRMTLSEIKSAGISNLLLIAAGVSLGLHFTLWIASLHYTSVASASVLVTIHPVMLIVAESLLFKTKFRPVVWIGVTIAFAGSVLLGLADDTQMDQFPDAIFGNTLAFLSAVVFVAYFMLGRKIRQHTEWIDYVFYVYSYATVTCLVLTFLWVGGIPSITATSVLVGIGLAAGPTVLGHGSMNYAVKYISPTLLSTLVLSEAVVAAIAAFFIFGEIPSGFSLVAMLVIVFGVTLTWIKRMNRSQKKKTIK